MQRELNLGKIQQICNQRDFIVEFLNLSLDLLKESKDGFKKTITEKDLLTYRKVAHKLKTTLILLELPELQNLVEKGKYIMVNNVSEIADFQPVLVAAIDAIITKIHLKLSQL